MNQSFLDYYRCPDRYADFRPSNACGNGRAPGYFRFGPGLCYGVSPSAVAAPAAVETLPDALGHVRYEGTTCYLPFDLTDVVTNLRQERYAGKPAESSLLRRIVRGAYYLVRPCLPVPVRRHLQKFWLQGWDSRPFPRWPVDSSVDQVFRQAMAVSLTASQAARIPFIWFWPEGKSSCAILTHDVETGTGLKFCDTLMDMNDSFSIKSSFQMIPAARYTVSRGALDHIRSRGFEINVHDLKHDGRLYQGYEQFQQQAEQINGHVTRFGCEGFRSAVLYRNLEWYGAFKFSYDMSVPNVGHLDPQPGGCCTVMPFYVGRILELPLTTTQDYSLFNILGAYSLDLWRRQIDMIRQQHGLISFNIHPDYVRTPRAWSTYRDLLHHLATLRSEAGVWMTLPGEVNTWWRQRSQMKMTLDGDQWRIEGPGAERARVAYATLTRDSVAYAVA